MKRFLLMGVLLWSFSSQAHPVSFQNSKGIMGYHSPSLTHNQINYSYRYWGAVGVHHFTRPDSLTDQKATLGSANFLLKRWNGEAFQANVYTILGAGTSELIGLSESVGMGAVQFDIEDRNYYFLSKYMVINDGDRDQLTQSTLRLGIAPYVGGYTDLHSWFILEWGKKTFYNEDPTEDLTPFLRFFYRNVLFEIGQSFDGVTKFNYIIHF